MPSRDRLVVDAVALLPAAAGIAPAPLAAPTAAAAGNAWVVIAGLQEDPTTRQRRRGRSATVVAPPLPLHACVRRWDAALRFCAAASAATGPATAAAGLDPALSPVAVAALFRSLRASAPALFLPDVALFNRVVRLLAVAAPGARASPLRVELPCSCKPVGAAAAKAELPSQSAHLDDCLDLAESMRRAGIQPDSNTYESLFRACEVSGAVVFAPRPSASSSTASSPSSAVTETPTSTLVHRLDPRWADLERAMLAHDSLPHSPASFRALLATLLRAGRRVDVVAQRLGEARAAAAAVPGVQAAALLTPELYAALFRAAAAATGSARPARWVLDDAQHELARAHPHLFGPAAAAAAASARRLDSAARKAQADAYAGLLECAAAASDPPAAWKAWTAARAACGDERCARDPRLAAALVRAVFEPMRVAGARGGLRRRPTETAGGVTVAMAMPAAPAAVDVAAIAEKVKDRLVGVRADQHPHLSALDATVDDADGDWDDVDDENGAEGAVHHSLDHSADAAADRSSAAILLARRAVIDLASIGAAAPMHAAGPVYRTLWRAGTAGRRRGGRGAGPAAAAAAAAADSADQRTVRLLGE
ncbi:hypothetical protein HK405_014809, partial [Cladochytrium tenue]